MGASALRISKRVYNFYQLGNRLPNLKEFGDIIASEGKAIAQDVGILVGEASGGEKFDTLFRVVVGLDSNDLKNANTIYKKITGEGEPQKQEGKKGGDSGKPSSGNGKKGDGEKDKIPNQGSVDGGYPNAPKVNAGSQGKHIVEHNNYNPQKSSWPKGEDGVKATQEAWMNGEYFDENERIKIYKHPKLDYIKVYQLSDGSIFGYPFGDMGIKDWEFEKLTPSSLVIVAQILRRQPCVFNFILGNFRLLKYCEDFWISYFQDFDIHFLGISDFNYSTCWSFLSQDKIKLQISIIAPFAKIEFCNDFRRVKRFEALLKNMGYLLLDRKQLELEVPNIHLENASLPANIDMCFFEEYYKDNNKISDKKV